MDFNCSRKRVPFYWGRSFVKNRAQHSILKRFAHSLLFRLLLIVIGTGILINVVAFYMLHMHMEKNFDKKVAPQLVQYVNYMHQDIGVPFDSLKARALSDKLGIDFCYEKGKMSWCSVQNLPSIQMVKQQNAEHAKVRKNKWSFPHLGIRIQNYHIFLVKDSLGKGTFAVYFKSEKWWENGKDKWMFPLVLFFLILVLYILIRHILRPIFWLTKASDDLKAGNLEARVKIHQFHKDELANLSFSFNEMADRLSEMLKNREQLLLDVSHELRTPLSRMKLQLEFLEEGRDKKRLTKEVREIELMVNELLEGARLDHSYGELNFETFDLAALVEECCESRKHRKPGIQTELPENVMVKADRRRIGILIGNLLENALKHSPEDVKPVHVQLIQQDSKASLIVADCGPGIPEQERERIFEPFYRIDKSRNRQTGGFGLGMSLCKKIADAHKGSLLVKESACGGALFRFELATFGE